MDKHYREKLDKKEKKPRHRALAKATKKEEKTVHSLKVKMNARQFLDTIEKQQGTESGITTKVPPKVLLAWRDTDDWKAFTDRLNETESGKLKQQLDEFRTRREKYQQMVEESGGPTASRPQIPLGDVID